MGKLSLPFVTFPICWLMPKQVFYRHPGTLVVGFPPGEINTERGLLKAFSTGAVSLGCEDREITYARQLPCLAGPLPLNGVSGFWPASVYLELICGLTPISQKPSQQTFKQQPTLDQNTLEGIGKCLSATLRQLGNSSLKIQMRSFYLEVVNSCLCPVKHQASA